MAGADAMPSLEQLAQSYSTGVKRERKRQKEIKKIWGMIPLEGKSRGGEKGKRCYVHHS